MKQFEKTQHAHTTTDVISVVAIILIVLLLGFAAVLAPIW